MSQKENSFMSHCEIRVNWLAQNIFFKYLSAHCGNKSFMRKIVIKSYKEYTHIYKSKSLLPLDW